MQHGLPADAPALQVILAGKINHDDAQQDGQQTLAGQYQQHYPNLDEKHPDHVFQDLQNNTQGRIMHLTQQGAAGLGHEIIFRNA